MTFDPSKHPRKPKGSPEGGQFTENEVARFDGVSPDGRVNGYMDVTVLDPFINRSEVTSRDEKGRTYKGAFRMLPRALVRTARGTVFEAYESQLSKKQR